VPVFFLVNLRPRSYAPSLVGKQFFSISAQREETARPLPRSSPFKVFMRWAARRVSSLEDFPCVCTIVIVSDDVCLPENTQEGGTDGVHEPMFFLHASISSHMRGLRSCGLGAPLGKFPFG